MAFDHPQTGVHRFLFVEAWLRVRGQQRGLARVPSVTKQVAIKLSHYCAVYFECADRERERVKGLIFVQSSTYHMQIRCLGYTQIQSADRQSCCIVL